MTLTASTFETGALSPALVDGLFLHVSQLSDEALSRAGVGRGTTTS